VTTEPEQRKAKLTAAYLLGHRRHIKGNGKMTTEKLQNGRNNTASYEYVLEHVGDVTVFS